MNSTFSVDIETPLSRGVKGASKFEGVCFRISQEMVYMARGPNKPSSGKNAGLTNIAVI